jgi:hypothetical protein
MDGRYLVRGMVSNGEGAATRPVVGASVAVGDTQDGASNGRALTAADGSYRAEYRFGGLFPFLGGSHPVVTVSAPGYRTCRFELQVRSTPSGVTRRPCDPPESGCFVVDLVLSPAASTERAQ